MNRPQIRSKYPLGDRFSLALSCCCRPLFNPVEIMKKQAPLFKYEEQYKDEYNRMAMKMKICETGSLVLD
jgi:hypothetical protein